MSKTYYSVLTTYGAQLFAQAMSNRRAVNITQFAVGDSGGRAVQPDSARTSLVRQVHRANVSAVSQDPRNNKQVIFELTIPETVGGFWIREMGIYDAQNRLVAYANCPDTYKPRLEEGSGKVQVMRMILLVSSSNAVTLTVDDSVIFATRGQLTPKTITASSQNGVDDTGHSHQIDRASTTQAGIVQLDSSTTSPSETTAATPKAVKTVKDLADSNTRSLQNVIPNSKKSNSVASTSSDTVATSYAVKQAYDLARGKQNPATTLAGYGITDFLVKSAEGDLNGFKIDGIYCFNSFSNMRNAPVGSSGHLFVMSGGRENASWCRQIFKKHYSGETYERWQADNTSSEWSAWVRVDGAEWLGVRGKPTTLSGYGITDSIRVDNTHLNTSLDGFFHTNTVWSVNGQDKQRVELSPEMYNFGVGVTLSSRLTTVSLYAPHRTDHPELWIKSHYNQPQYRPSPWERVAMWRDFEAFTGSIAFFATSSAPNGWLKANGAAVSRTTYAALFARIGTTFGTGDGQTTFNLPDLRGEFIRGWDDGRNLDVGRRFGEAQQGSLTTIDLSPDEQGASIHGLSMRKLSSVNTPKDLAKMAGFDLTNTNDVNHFYQLWVTKNSYRYVEPVSSQLATVAISNSSGDIGNGHINGFTRPRNVALLACIKY